MVYWTRAMTAGSQLVAPAARRLDRHRLGGASRTRAGLPASRRRSTRRAGGATLLLLRVRGVELRQHVFRVALRVDLLPDLLDPALGAASEPRVRVGPV